MKKLLTLMAAALLAVGLCGCDYSPPAVTGTADDGLWLYAGNTRCKSDLSGKEKLVENVESDGALYRSVDVTDTVYTDDGGILMCVTYSLSDRDGSAQYNAEPTRSERGGCLIRYDLKEKRSEVLFDGETEYAVKSVTYYNENSDRYLLDTEKGFVIVERGEIAEVCEEKFYGNGGNSVPWRYTFTEAGIFRYRVGSSVLESRSWDSPAWKSLYKVPNNLFRITSSGQVLYVSTRHVVNNFEYYALYAYQTEKELWKCLSDERQEEATIDSESGLYLKGSVRIFSTPNGLNLYGYDYSLWQFDCETFSERKIAALDIRDARWRIYRAERNFLFLQGYITETSSYAYRLYEPETERILTGKFSDFIREVHSVLDNEEYSFYYSTKSRGMFAGDYYALHRLRKSDGKDDVMYVTEGYQNPYHFDALLCY